MKILKRAAAFIIAAATALSLGACGTAPVQETPNGSDTRTITDALGREVTIPESVEKIVPLGNTPRMITYLGLADKVVGIGDCEIASSPLQAYAYVNLEKWKDLPIVGSDSMGETQLLPGGTHKPRAGRHSVHLRAGYRAGYRAADRPARRSRD